MKNQIVEPEAFIKIDVEIRKVYKITKKLLVRERRKEAYEIIRYYKWHFMNRKESLPVTDDIRKAWQALNNMERLICHGCSASVYGTPWRKSHKKTP